MSEPLRARLLRFAFNAAGTVHAAFTKALHLRDRNAAALPAQAPAAS